MKIQRSLANKIVLLMTVLLALPAHFAFSGTNAPMTPDLAAKKEMVRKQQEQRITPEKRKLAAEALKAERAKVYNAKKAVQQTTPLNTDNK